MNSNTRKTTISSREEQQTGLYTNENRTQLKAKGTYKKISKYKNINNYFFLHFVGNTT